MPTPIMRAEVSYLGNVPDAVVLPGDAAEYWTYFRAEDTFNAFGIAGRLYPDATTLSGYRLEYQFYFNASGDPLTWAFISGTHTLTSADDAVFVFPDMATLSITKDFDADTVTWDCPLGSQTRPLSGFTMDSTRLRPACFGDGMVGGSNAVGHDASALVMAFYGLENGAPYLGAAMTSTAPGIWLATVQYTSGVGVPWPNTDTQLVDGYQMGYTAGPGTGPHRFTRRLRCWDGGDNLGPDNPNFRLDMVKNRLSGEIALTGVLPEEPNRLYFWWSDDDGVTLNPVVVAEEPGVNYRYPNIVSFPDGRLVIFVRQNNVARLYFKTSFNQGRTWTDNESDHFTLSPLGVILDTRVRLDPTGQLLYILYISQLTDTLQLSRFATLLPPSAPIDALPNVIDTGLASFEQPDVYWDGAGNVYVTYIAGDSLTPATLKSSDLGQTWSPVAAFSTISHRRQSDTALLGLTFHSFQDTVSNVVTVGVSENAGISFLSIAEVVTVEPQYCPLAGGDREQLWLAYTTFVSPSRVPRIARSDDLGSHWSTVTTSP